ncbi:MAG: glycosyltransferase family 4 protein [Bacteroidales bacterium]|nr:glycosyltransferase family 4 protein [Bacteroidales bacterium]
MKKQRVLLVNKFYYNRGGDCVATLALEKLLLEKGYEVAIFSMQYPQNIPSGYDNYYPSEVSFTGGIKNKLNAAARIFGIGDVKKQFLKLLKDFNPDVVHLHNIHSYISPIVAKLAKIHGCKVIWTMHDYKLICPSYLCYNRGKICEKCVSSSTLNVIKNRCMKDSLLASSLAYLESVYWSKKKLISYTDKFIAPSNFMKEMLVKASFPQEKIEVLPNFINREFSEEGDIKKEDYYCFVGRLEDIKGIRTLVEAAKQLPYRLIIIGDGSLKNKFINSPSNIEFVGFKEWSDIEKILSRAKFLVTPSECYEVFGLGNIEAQCLGTPVLGANIGGIPETITAPYCGMLFKSYDVQDLKTKIEIMYSRVFDYELIRESARSKFSKESYYNKIVNLYY